MSLDSTSSAIFFVTVFELHTFAHVISPIQARTLMRHPIDGAMTFFLAAMGLYSTKFALDGFVGRALEAGVRGRDLDARAISGTFGKLDICGFGFRFPVA